MNSLIRSYGRGIVLKRHRSVLVQRIGMMATAAILALVHSACTEMLSDPQQAAYPRFALTGEVPDRVTAFDLTIDADDIRPIEERIHIDEGPHAFHVPLGTGRTIELLSVGDVYSGRITRDFNNGGEYEVTVPLVAGPVVPDPLNERVVQIRDISGAGWRGFPDPDGDLQLQDVSFVDAQYDDSGRLWLVDNELENPRFVAFDDLSTEDAAVAPLEPERAFAVAFDSDASLVYIFTFEDEVKGVLQATLDGEVTGPIIDVNLDLVGLAVRDDGTLLGVGGEAFAYSDIVHIDPRADEDPVIETIDLVEAVQGWDGIDPWADITIRGDHAYVTNAAAPQNHVIRIDTDLDPDSIVPVQPPDGEAFLGPRRFAATRDDMGPIIVTDQDPDDPEAPGRLVAFENVDGEGWTTLEHNPDDPDDEFAFFEFGGE